jgi:hypothetical protein
MINLCSCAHYCYLMVVVMMMMMIVMIKQIGRNLSYKYIRVLVITFLLVVFLF